MRPWFITAMRSLMVSASSWSWVTKTKVVPQALLQVLHLHLHLLAQLQVEGGHRLVEQQHLRLEHDRPRQRHALLLPAGELVDAAMRRGPARRTMSSALATRLAISARGTPVISRPKATLPRDRAVREQRVVLEHGVDGAAVRRLPGDVAARDEDARRRPAVSKPAIRRSSVVLPQPEGPSSVRNSPAATSSETSSTATTSPYDLRTERSDTAPPTSRFGNSPAAVPKCWA